LAAFAGDRLIHSLRPHQGASRGFRGLFDEHQLALGIPVGIATLVNATMPCDAKQGLIAKRVQMSAAEPNKDSAPDRAGWFATTHWSVVLAAKQGEPTEAFAALEKLCGAYWPPLYAYIRREGHDATEAQDLTQEFFARLVEKNHLSQLHHQQGKFRSFLLTFLKHFLSEQRRKEGAQKRGGGRMLVSLDELAGENSYLFEPVDHLTPDEVFERRWAQAVLQTALDRLRGEYSAKGQARLFERLQDYQPREPGGRSYAELGEEFAMTESAVKSAVQRMRQRHRELLREEIAHTVARPEEIEEEVRHFRALLARERG
jgi:RNA polymerase sigma-70 factor (ECF subfamily)